MTKLFGAVVGFLSFFQTRPTDKAKVVRNSIFPSWLITPFFCGTQIDNSVFRLHYDFTVGFFFLATGLLRYKGFQFLPCFNQFICICQPQRFVWESDSLPWVGRVKSDRGPRCSHTILLGFWNLYRLESATYTFIPILKENFLMHR